MALGLGDILGIFDTLRDPEPTRITPSPTRVANPQSLPPQQQTPLTTPILSRIATSFRPPTTPRVGTSLSHTVTPTSPFSSVPSVPTNPSVRGGRVTVTASVPASTFVDQSVPPVVNTRTGAQAQGFLENKPLSGFVFVLSGLVVLVAITMIATCAMRRRQRRKMMNEAMLFDAASMIHDPYNQNGAKEKGRSGLSRSNTGGSARKRMSDESFGHGYVAQGYTGAVADGGADTYGLPALAYAPPSTTYSPQYPQAAHSEPRLKAYGEREYYGHDHNQPLW